MKVFPEELEKLDTSNNSNAYMVERYIRYMCERLDHAISVLEKNQKDMDKRLKKLEK